MKVYQNQMFLQERMMNSKIHIDLS